MAEKSEPMVRGGEEGGARGRKVYWAGVSGWGVGGGGKGSRGWAGFWG